MKRTIILILLLIILSPTKVLAACKPESETTVDLTECAAQEYKQADDQLNKVYQGIMKWLTGQYRQNMIQAESAWIQYRDKNCAYESALYEGGSMRPMVELGCMTRLTKARTQELQTQQHN